jgi:glutamate-1-semialdehyde 2,1-aminomutase
LDGNKYLDMGIMSVGSCVLGYADADVNKAVKQAIDASTMSTLNPPEEVELAEVLIKMHPWADQARFMRAGGEAMAAAIRIARAASGKDKIAFCGYHGWQDWYLAANLSDNKALDGHLLSGLNPGGVPRELTGTMLPFHYNAIEELEAIVRSHGKDIGVIVMEPVKGQEPKDDFLKKVRAIADRIGAVLIFDEITVGFKLTLGGAHLLYGVDPDMAVFSKAMSNGFPMAAVIGRKKIMEAAQGSFISSTYWTERMGPVAALATIKKMRATKVWKRLHVIGVTVRKGWVELAQKHGFVISIGGVMAISSFSFQEVKDPQALKTLFIQEMLDRGFLVTTALFASAAHTDAHIKSYLRAVDQVFGVLREALDTDTVHTRLRGPVAHTGFARLN